MVSFIIEKIWPLLSFAALGILGASIVESEYDLNKCYTWDELDQTLTKELGKFTDGSNLEKYEYTSVKPRVKSNYQPCTSNDVTRIESALEVNDEEIYNTTMNITSNTEETAMQIKNSLKNKLTAGGIQSAVKDVDVKFDISRAPPTTVWTVELVVKGRSSTVASDMKEEIKKQTEKTSADSIVYELENVGEIDVEKISFKVILCTGNPPSGPQNGRRTWTSEQFPGTKATYSCNTGYFLSDDDLAFSECQHDDLTWSTPEVSITCSKGCQELPPVNPPFFTEKDGWTSDKRGDGDVATYVCMEGYRSAKNEKGTSTCKNSQWTAIDMDNFNCELIECSKFIPQVPEHAKTDWDGKTLRPYTKIVYSCLDGYTQKVEEEVVVECDKEGNWTAIHPDFCCVNNERAKELGIFDRQRVIEYDYYTYAKDNLGKGVPEHSNLFLVVVLSFGAILLIILLACCVTRIDSPIFIICTGSAKKTNYIPPK